MSDRSARILELILILIAVLFVASSSLTLGLIRKIPFAETLWPALLTLGLGITAWALLAWHLPQHDPLILPSTLLLAGWGLIEIARLIPTLAARQAIWMAIGTIGMLLVALLPYSWTLLQRYRYTWLSIGLLLLFLSILFGTNPIGTGPRLWLSLAGLYLQPSEALKPLFIIFLASYLAEKRELLSLTGTRLGPIRLPPLPYLGPILAMWGFSVLLLIWQRDLGAALLFFGTFLGMLYAATNQSRYLAVGLLLFCVSGAIGYLLFDHVRLRVGIWLNPWIDAQGRAYQIVQGLIAYASGGAFGQGFAQGYPEYIPVAHSDLVLAAIGEEWGLAGTGALLLIEALIALRGLHIALHTDDRFTALLVTGVAVLLAWQTWIIAAGTLKLIPLTGVTLPFVSYGGSSLIVSMTMVGWLIRASKPTT